MSSNPSHTSNTSASTRLSSELSRLRQKLTSSPTLPQFQSNNHPAPLIPSSNDTPDTATLIISSASSTSTSSQATASNPIREVYFPHNRTSGPGTKKCVGRPGRPNLSINTAVPVVSLLADGRRYGTPWRDAAPARYGPDGMRSSEMGRWLRGDKGKGGSGGGGVEMEGEEDDDDGPWFEIDLGSEDGEGGEEEDSGAWSDTDPNGGNGEVGDGEEMDGFGLSPVCCATDEFGLPVLEYSDESDDEEDFVGISPVSGCAGRSLPKRCKGQGSSHG